jgi:capsular polysaccharide biosynthesis protein
MEIKIYWQMIRKGWWIVFLTALVAVNVALVTNYFSRPIFQAKANFLVSPNPKLLAVTDMVYSLDALGNRSTVMTYSEFLRNQQVYSDTINQLKLDAKDIAINYKITTLVLPDTSIIELAVEGPDPKLCSLLANTLGQNGVTYIRHFYNVYEINSIEPARVALYPIRPQPLRDASLALALGLILGAVLALLSDQIRVPLESLRQRRLIDNVSGVYTRQHLEHLLEEEMLRSKKNNDVFSLGLVRLNGLVGIIDALPLIVAQRIFQNTTSILRNLLKGTDIIGQWDRTTYAILLPSTPYTASNKLMNRVCQSLSTPVELFEGGDSLFLNPYVGVARSQVDEPLSDFISRTQKDLDESRFGIPQDIHTGRKNNMVETTLDATVPEKNKEGPKGITELNSFLDTLRDDFKKKDKFFS